MQESGFIRNDYDVCVFNKRTNGVQCTIAVHVDDLIITSVDQQMIEDICGKLKGRYGVMTRHDGPVLNYLGMVFDLTKTGEVSMTMKGYTLDTILYAGISGRARSPATDGLFEVRDTAELVPEEQRSWFHSVVAQPECLFAKYDTAVRHSGLALFAK